jgi:hypothetical protein
VDYTSFDSLRKGPLAGAATPRERERQIAPKKARHFFLKVTKMNSDHPRRNAMAKTVFRQQRIATEKPTHRTSPAVEAD